MSDWRPIDSAPASPTRILLHDGRTERVGRAERHLAFGGIARCVDDRGDTVEATHWCPIPPPPPKEVRAPSEGMARYLGAVDTLLAAFEAVQRPLEWVAKRYPMRMRDPDGGDAIVMAPLLVLQRGPTHLMMRPLGCDEDGTGGSVDLASMPGCDRVAWLDREGDGWVVRWYGPDGADGDPVPLSATTPESILAEAEARVIDRIGRPPG